MQAHLYSWRASCNGSDACVRAGANPRLHRCVLKLCRSVNAAGSRPTAAWSSTAAWYVAAWSGCGMNWRDVLRRCNETESSVSLQALRRDGVRGKG
jgi:hypothetical protein